MLLERDLAASAMPVAVFGRLSSAAALAEAAAAGAALPGEPETDSRCAAATGPLMVRRWFM